jgi:hypothetical protein
MSNYPSWVLKHKKKGTYINHVGGRYYLYSAHSERIHGTNKVRRVSDGYLGRITEKDGLIPAKSRISDKIYVYEYGLTRTIELLCKNIYSGIYRSFRANANFVMVSGILLAIYRDSSQTLYNATYLSLRFPGVDLSKPTTEKQQSAIQRVSLMVTDTLKKTFKEDYHKAISLLPLVYKVKSGNMLVTSVISSDITAFMQKHNINIEEE